MPRPFKCRRIAGSPGTDYFKPRGIPLAELEEAELTLEEFEAVRLADLAELYQEEAAGKMNISRQTFGNIIVSAHRKIADAIVNGKALKIMKNSNVQAPPCGMKGTGMGGRKRCCRRGAPVSAKALGDKTTERKEKER